MWQWRIKEQEAIAKAKEMELRGERDNIYKGNKMHLLKEAKEIFQGLVRILFGKEKRNVRNQ